MIVNFALHMQSHGISRASCVRIDCNISEAIIALPIAAALLGCSWLHASAATGQNKALNITHLLHDGGRPYLESINIIKIGKSWFDRPAGINARQPIAFEGYASPDDPWMITHSSGTTGSAKFMAISAAMAWRRLHEPLPPQLDNAPILASLFPQSSIPAVRTRTAVFARGGTLVAGSSYAYFAANGVNFMVGSPNQFAQLLRRQPPPARPGISVARLLGGSISAAFLQTMLRYFESVLYLYGSTEASAVCSNMFTGAQTGKISAGRAVATAQLRIVDDDGNDSPKGAEGVVKLRSDSQVAGYIGDPAATAASFRDGWFYPGDLGYLSEDGELYITGRADDVLNVGGSKINAAIADEIIQTTPGVIDGICFIQSTPQGLQEIAAVISLSNDFDAAAVATEIRKRLVEKVKRKAVPKRIYLCETIPRNPSGKIVRGAAVNAVSGIEPI